MTFDGKAEMRSVGVEITLHSAYSGKKAIALPGPYRVYDVISGKLYSKKADRIVFDLDAPETRIFRLEAL